MQTLSCSASTPIMSCAEACAASSHPCLILPPLPDPWAVYLWQCTGYELHGPGEAHTMAADGAQQPVFIVSFGFKHASQHLVLESPLFENATIDLRPLMKKARLPCVLPGTVLMLHGFCCMQLLAAGFECFLANQDPATVVRHCETGLDAHVRQQIVRQTGFPEALERGKQLIQQKGLVAYGCNAGRHRSPTLAIELANWCMQEFDHPFVEARLPPSFKQRASCGTWVTLLTACFPHRFARRICQRHG